jgi:AcrR family transcriptional regulator
MAQPARRRGTTGRRGTKRDIRGDILAAAQQIVEARGPHFATTREIARIARCSEGSIYRYFDNKYTLFSELTGTSLPELTDFVVALPSRAVEVHLEENMAELARLALAFYQQIVPFASAGITDPRLRATQRRQVHKQEQQHRGPLALISAVGDYLAMEQAAGRARPDVSPVAVAGALLGSCFARAFIVRWLGEHAKLGFDDSRFIEHTVNVLLLGASPGDEIAPADSSGAPHREHPHKEHPHKEHPRRR